jgi:hypothetical protein
MIIPYVFWTWRISQKTQRQLKEVPGTAVPTTLSYLARLQPGSEVPSHSRSRPARQQSGRWVDMEARHQVVLGANYHF